MKPAVFDLNIYKGSTFELSVQWKTGSPAAPVDLTGCTARMQIRERVNSETVVDELTTENSRIVITDAVNGKLTLKVPANVSSQYAINSGVYDLEVVLTNGEPYRIMEGSVSANPEVTR